MKSLLRATTVCVMALSIMVVPTNAQAPAPPTGLNQQVSGNLVSISWNSVTGAVAYVVQVGSGPGASNLFNAPVGNVTAASGSVPGGTYFWRVIAVGPSGELSAPSAESQFTVGAVGPCVPPGPPQSFTSNVANNVVSLFWAAPLAGTPPFTYIIEAGSDSGLANLAVLPTGSSATQFATAAPAGTYYVRLRAQNACGVGGVSTEQVVSVGNVGGPCTYAVAPAQITAPAAGGPITVNVAAPGGCRWQLSSDPFIIATTPTSGSGSAAVAFNVLATSVSRTGVVTVTGIDPGPVITPQVLVQQTVGASTGCGLTLGSTSHTVGSEGGTFTLTVNANPGCTWTGEPTMGFIQVVNPGPKNGPGIIEYHIDPYQPQGSRTGALRVSTLNTSPSEVRELAITQLGSSPPPLTASFVLTQDGSSEGECQFRVFDGNVLPGPDCVLDASASAPSGEIASYEWRLVVGRSIKDYYEKRVVLALDCDGCSHGQQQFTVTLTVRGSGGQTATRSRQDLKILWTMVRQ